MIFNRTTLCMSTELLIQLALGASNVWQVTLSLVTIIAIHTASGSLGGDLFLCYALYFTIHAFDIPPNYIKTNLILYVDKLKISGYFQSK